MKPTTGHIYEFDGLSGKEYGLALHQEQSAILWQKGKIYIKVFTDPQCTIPAMDEKNRQRRTLKAIGKLKLIGYQD